MTPTVRSTRRRLTRSLVAAVVGRSVLCVGITGSLTITLKPDSDGVTAAQKLAKIRSMCSLKYGVTLRDPFGSSYKVAIGTLAWQHESGYGETEVITGDSAGG